MSWQASPYTASIPVPMLGSRITSSVWMSANWADS